MIDGGGGEEHKKEGGSLLLKESMMMLSCLGMVQVFSPVTLSLELHWEDVSELSVIMEGWLPLSCSSSSSSMQSYGH